MPNLVVPSPRIIGVALRVNHCTVPMTVIFKDIAVSVLRLAKRRALYSSNKTGSLLDLCLHYAE